MIYHQTMQVVPILLAVLPLFILLFASRGKTADSSSDIKGYAFLSTVLIMIGAVLQFLFFPDGRAPMNWEAMGASLLGLGLLALLYGGSLLCTLASLARWMGQEP